jgi:ribose 5-phosphate isomerase A
MTTNDAEREKELSAAAAVALVEDGMVVGLGTGSTAKHAVRMIGERVRAGLKIRGIPTSSVTKTQADQEGIPLVGFDEITKIDLTIDGADEFDPHLRLTKGGGGALLFEKIVAAASDRLIVVCDAKKEVPFLGAFPLPVEVVPFGWQQVAARIKELGAQAGLRTRSDGKPFVTDAHHYILDCRFGEIRDPPALARALDAIVGVVEHGLFIDLADRVILAEGDRVREIKRH